MAKSQHLRRSQVIIIESATAKINLMTDLCFDPKVKRREMLEPRLHPWPPCRRPGRSRRKW